MLSIPIHQRRTRYLTLLQKRATSTPGLYQLISSELCIFLFMDRRTNVRVICKFGRREACSRNLLRNKGQLSEDSIWIWPFCYCLHFLNLGQRKLSNLQDLCCMYIRCKRSILAFLLIGLLRQWSFRDFGTILDHDEDCNVFPMVFAFLSFLQSTSTNPAYYEHFHEYVPRGKIVRFLNRLDCVGVRATFLSRLTFIQPFLRIWRWLILSSIMGFMRVTP